MINLIMAHNAFTQIVKPGDKCQNDDGCNDDRFNRNRRNVIRNWFFKPGCFACIVIFHNSSGCYCANWL